VEFGEGKVPLDNIAKRAAVYKPKERVTYKMIKEYIEAKYGFKVHTAYILELLDKVIVKEGEALGRIADSTIKGFMYQFNLSLNEILKSTNAIK